MMVIAVLRRNFFFIKMEGYILVLTYDAGAVQLGGLVHEAHNIT